jgi:hypothetical protein
MTPYGVPLGQIKKRCGSGNGLPRVGTLVIFLILIWEFSWSKTKNLNTVVETKMSGVEIFKMFEYRQGLESDIALKCIFCILCQLMHTSEKPWDEPFQNCNQIGHAHPCDLLSIFEGRLFVLKTGEI